MSYSDRCAAFTAISRAARTDRRTTPSGGNPCTQPIDSSRLPARAERHRDALDPAAPRVHRTVRGDCTERGVGSARPRRRPDTADRALGARGGRLHARRAVEAPTAGPGLEPSPVRPQRPQALGRTGLRADRRFLCFRRCVAAEYRVLVVSEYAAIMTTYIGLLRAVNLGPTNRVAMADLRTLLAELGLSDVKSFLQSGNWCFEAASPPPNWKRILEVATRSASDLPPAFSSALRRTGDDDRRQPVSDRKPSAILVTSSRCA